MYPLQDASSRGLARVAVVLAAALSLAGCGGGGGDDGNTGGDSVAVPSAEATAAPALSSSGAQAMRVATTPSSAIVQAHAGTDQFANQATTVVLRGSGSVAPAGTAPLSYAWKQLEGPPVTLSNRFIAQPMFKTPFVTTTTVLLFALTVGSAGSSASDTVAITVNRDSPWGVAPSAALSYNPEAWLPAMSDAGVTSVRGFHSSPTGDRLSPITGAGLSAVGFLQWSSGGTQSLPANDLPGWRKYVTEQVTRYKGRVKHWEVWNEPPNFTADRSPASYAKVVAAAYEAAKAVDPTVQIGLAAKSNHVNWLAESIAAGAADKFDFVTLHPYEVAGFLPQGWEGQFMAIAPRVRKMLQDRNPAKAGVPVWFTEIGISAAPATAGGVGPQMQADVLAKIYTMAIAQGVARVYWFDPSDSEGLTMGLTTANGTRRPAWQALRSLATYLGVRPRYAGWTQPDGAYYGFVFDGPKGVVLSAWTRPGQSVPLALASDVTVVNPGSGTVRVTRTPTVTDTPALLVAPAGSAQAQQWLRDAAVGNGRAFPWNGDHSASTSVSLTAGGAADGVFMANAPTPVVVNSVAEFDLEGRDGATFAVDPTFLNYAVTPIRITAIVRGHGHGDPGFNLKYESDAPISSADGNGLVASGTGWFRVPGTSFYEKTWTVPNARFVGMYGYNFRFDTDGPSHAQFSLQRVTVSR